MPDSPHAVSACLPLWEHNVAYEEGDERIIGQMKAGYPRFCLHPLVRALCRQTFGGENRGLIFPSLKAAQRAVDYVAWRGAVTARLVTVNGHSGMVSDNQNRYHGVAISEEEFPTLREYWQHAGEVVTSRAVELIQQGKPVVSSETAERGKVRNRVAEFQGCTAHDVWLFPCGMAAMAAVLRAIRLHDPVNPSVQFGFPYVDTLKLQQRFTPAVCRFFPVGDADDVDELEGLLESQRISAVFCECPTNPLLVTPDLRRLRSLADRHNFLLVIDDTLTALLNERLLPLADVLVTSLTKYFSGYGDVLAGCASVNPAGRHSAWLRDALNQDFEELLPDVDVAVLELNSRDVRERVTRMNLSAQVLATRLSAHPMVHKVFYPSLVADGMAARKETDGTGSGALMSIVLRNAAVTTPVFYDNLELCKGPNLGTNFTLCCPYTILAHYTELDLVEQYGVSRWLLRLSVGTEPVEELWSRFERAFAAVCQPR